MKVDGSTALPIEHAGDVSFSKSTEWVSFSSDIPNEKEEKRYKVLDLFSGCGGLSKGFELAGFDILATGKFESFGKQRNYGRSTHGFV